MSEIGFGTWSWGNQLLWGYSPNDHDQFLKEAFNAAIESGLDFIDTADSYGTGNLNGRSETLLGKYIHALPKHKKRSITIATKLAPFPWRIGRKGFYKAFFASKERLQNKIDRVQLHWSTSRYAPWQEAQLIDGLCDLYEKGLFSEIGVSNMGPLRLKWVHKRLQERGIPLKSVQIQFSLLSPEPNKSTEIKNVCKELNIEFLAYSPLALGILAIPPTQEIKPKTLLRRSIFNLLIPSTKELREGLHNIARNNNASQVQVALNWCRSHGTKPIPGIRKASHAIDIGKAIKWKITNSEKSLLDELSRNSKVRMPNNPFQSI